MEADTANRYRSRILREMNANRDNPFNSPPSSTGSHGTVSPTLSSVFSDPDGESTRKLNEDIARVTGPRKLPVNWEAAHRKWPEFYGMPKGRDAPIFDDNTDTRPMSAESKENKPPASAARFNDDSTQNTWSGSKRTRAEMQPRVDEGSDLSAILAKPPSRSMSYRGLNKDTRHPSPLAKSQRVPSAPTPQPQRRPSISEALDRLRRASLSPRNGEQKDQGRDRGSPNISSAKSSMTAVPPSPASNASPGHNASNVRSFFMPDVSHLGDFVTGTLRFSGNMQNGVPVFVKHGKVHDRRESPAAMRHAAVDGVEVPEEEEKIFVSMDMIRNEIVSLQEHYDKVHDYAEDLQRQVEKMEVQLKSGKSMNGGLGSDRVNEHLVTQKNRLELEVESLQSRLEQSSRRISLNEIENESLVHEKDRAIKKLQEACDDINKLTRKLSMKEKELETSHRQLESTEQMRHDNDTLQRDLVSLKHGRDALELEIATVRSENEALSRDQQDLRNEAESLRSDNNLVRREHQSLISENISLRSNNKALMEENEDLRENLDGVQHELDAVREEVESLRQELEDGGQLREDNASLVRHNEKYFDENKILRRENSGFERSVHDLQDENAQLKKQIESLRDELGHCRPVPKEDFSARLDDETEENMTSAFFIPDITMDSNDPRMQNTETKEMPAPPELTSHSTKPVVSNGNDQNTRDTKQRSSSMSKSKIATQSQKVAFSLPDRSSQGTNVANQGSKRRNSKAKGYRNYFEDEDTTGLQSVDTTQDQSGPLNVNDPRDSTVEDQRPRTQEVASHSEKPQRARSQSRSSMKRNATTNVTTESTKMTGDACPALSNDARQVLDNLCEHNCRNCIVCSRITSHAGVISSHDFATGKKRVTVARPVPVTDRDLSTEDPTMRPSQSPGHALALVIKGLEDESHHLQLELSRLQAQYNGSDKSLGRRDRLALAEGIRTLLKRLEVKNDQIYSLYDVLEGQKAANQAMSEEEIEMTVLNITGMTVRDVTSGSEQFTWEGIQEV